MTFDINAVVSGAIARGLNHYKDQLLTNPEQADALKSNHASILRTISEGFIHTHLQGEATQMLIDLFPTFERWGYWTECIDIYQAALSLDLPAEQQVHLHANLARTYFLYRNFDDSLNQLKKGLAIAEEHQIDHLLGLLHHRLMNTYIGRLEEKTAKEHGLRALAYLSGTGSNTLAAAYDGLGRISLNLENFAMAEDYFWEALSLWDNLKDYTHMARSYTNLGYVFLRQNNLIYAKKCFESSLNALKNSQSVYDEVNAKNGLGIVNYSSGNYNEAASFFLMAANQLEKEFKNAGWYDMLGSLLHNIGNSHLALEDPQQALIYLDRAKTVWLQANNKLEMGNTVGTIAEAYQKEEDWETAVATYDEALSLLAQFPGHAFAERLTKNFTQEKNKCAEHLNNPPTSR
ncbi:MAG: hypothetical protein DHS20C20_09210 [Ardenticatenaceae bacterium]|nr:MAG: hypothetical protein DHS20C20_09210 [Ardenticatenaceae bacterium]